MKQKQNQRARIAMVIALVALGVLVLGVLAADPELRRVAGLSFAFQVACWALALILLVWKSPRGELRISDPGVLVMLWCAAYLVYPSFVWYQGGRIPHVELFSTDLYVSLFWMHGLFMLGFAGAYALVGQSETGVSGRLDETKLPSGWPLLIVSLMPLMLGVVGRVFTGGGLLFQGTYGDAWYSERAGLLSSQESGGLAYVMSQIQSKAWFYLIMLRGIGAGLLLAVAWVTGRRRGSTIALIMGVTLVSMLLGEGGRSAALMVVFIALALTDLLAGRIQWRYLVAVALVGLFAFEFMAFFRGFRPEGFGQATTMSIDALLEREMGELTEFPGMLTKEAAAVQFFREVGIDGPIYLVQSVLAIVPSQLVPGKSTWTYTSRIILDLLLGRSAYYTGLGTAGAIVGDGYRLAGFVGVPLLGAILGLGWGLVRKWALSGWKGSTRPILLRVVLLASLCAWTFDAVRGSLAGFLVIVLYYLILPWLVLSATLVRNRANVWISPLPVHKSGGSTEAEDARDRAASVRAGMSGSAAHLPRALSKRLE